MPLVIEQSLRESDRFPVLFHHNLAENPEVLNAARGPTLKLIREDLKVPLKAIDDKYVNFDFPSQFVSNTTIEQLTNLIFMVRDELDGIAGTTGELNSTFYRYPVELNLETDLPKQVISTRLYVTFFTLFTYSVFAVGLGLFILRFLLHWL